MERVVVLGHSGFIGGTIHRRLQALPAGPTVVGLSTAGIDLTRPEELERLESHLGPRAVVVLASGLQKRFSDSEDLYLRNVAMAANLSSVIRRRPPGALVFLSSTGVYGEDLPSGPLHEGSPPRPTSFYAASKEASERLLGIAARAAGSRLLVLRLPVIYGPGDRNDYGPTGFLRAALEGREVVLWGDGRELREFVHVDDVARALEGLLARRAAGVVNLVSGKACSFRSCLKDAERLLGWPLRFRSRPRTRRKVDSVFRPGRLQRLLPGFRFTPLGEGFRRTLGALREER